MTTTDSTGSTDSTPAPATKAALSGKEKTMFTKTLSLIRPLTVLTTLSTLAIAATTAGCSGEESVKADAEVVDRTSQALAAGSLLSINGTYGEDCTARSGAWSVAIEDEATLDNPALSVVKNDTACELTLTSIVADQEYAATPDILLESTYQSSASDFKGAGVDPPVAFHANAKINPDDFSSNFLITVLYSDDPNAASGANNASYAEWTSSAVGDHVAAPDYLVVDNVAVQVDANDVVTLALGSVTLTDGSVTGERYFVDLGALPASPSYAEIVSAFDGGSTSELAGPNPTIDAAEFDLVGQTLPVTRTLVVRHVESGVASFQTFRVTFEAP